MTGTSGGLPAPFASCLESYFTSGEFSDLTVKCKSDVYRAHKVVVCSQSQFFKAACSGGFKESHTGILEFPEEEPSIVRAALRYFYGLDYTKDSDAIGLVLHAKVYMFADKYGIPALLSLSLEKFEAAAKADLDITDFTESVRIVYKPIPSGNHRLRDIVIREAVENAETLFQKGEGSTTLDEMMGEVAEFSRDLAKGLLKNRSATKKYKCPSCRRVWSASDIATNDGSYYRCLICGYSNGSNWKAYEQK